ncbi:hypothetical protein AB0F91_10080 [Amycolatopsis sp. NPDC023774]|uniref:hypothetical protein n=1 Tax=Amycolatopsis sp. NPDC023774 TaxID=3155015 RepID=UPI0033D3C533
MLGEERVDALPGHAAHDLADEESVGQRVVATGRAGREQQFLRGRQPRDRPMPTTPEWCESSHRTGMSCLR